MPSEYQTDSFILTAVNSDCQATRTGFLNKPNTKKLRSQELSLELMLQSNLGSFAKPYFKIHITGSNLEKKMASSTNTVHFSATHLLTFWRLSGRTKLRTHNNRLCTNKSSDKIGFSHCRRSWSSENAEHFSLQGKKRPSKMSQVGQLK